MQGLWNLIGKGQGPGRDFNYEIGDVIQGCDGKSVWTIHKGKNKVKTKLDLNRDAGTLDTSLLSPLLSPPTFLSLSSVISVINDHQS